MTSFHLIYSTFVIALICRISASSEGTRSESASWSYDSGNTGPNFWNNMFPTCNGRNQSPINVNMPDVELSEQNINLVFYGYDTPPSRANAFSAVNNGRTALITIDKNLPDKMKIAEGGLGSSYTLEQFHFHWGEKNEAGSEHKIDGKSFGLEIHLVHYADKFKSVDEALSSNGAVDVAVLAVFVNEANDDSKPLSVGLGKIADSLQKIANQGDTTNIEVFALDDLLPPKGSRNFFRYMGSLTTPPCNEVVIWTVFSTEIYITSEQLSKFHTMLYQTVSNTTRSVQFTHNDRSVQPLNGRRVYLFTDADTQQSSSNGVNSLSMDITGCILLNLISRTLALLAMMFVVD